MLLLILITDDGKEKQLIITFLNKVPSSDSRDELFVKPMKSIFELTKAWGSILIILSEIKIDVKSEPQKQKLPIASTLLLVWYSLMFFFGKLYNFFIIDTK